MKSNWGGSGWGTWHTGDGSACPQGDGSHNIETAMRLNEVAREKVLERLRAAHERWLGKA